MQRRFPLFLAFLVAFCLVGLWPTSPALAVPPPLQNEDTQAAQHTVYVVRYGDNLSGIASRFGVSVQAILAANPSIVNPNVIYVGQIIRIPGRYTPPPVPPPGTGLYHTVQRGESLIRISQIYGVPYLTIAAANGLGYPYTIYVGQRLLIPGRNQPPPPPPPATQTPGCYHNVQRGESLSTIGRLYGVDPYAVASANGIGYPYTIYVGQRLFIPRQGCAPQQPQPTTPPQATATTPPQATATTPPQATATTPPQATTTQVPPTATQVPPTATQVPPTPTIQPTPTVAYP